MSHVYEEVDAAYAAACSDGTLCSSTRGFFRGLADEICSLAPAELLDRLPGLPESARIAAVTEEPQVMCALTEVLSRVTPLHRGKEPGTAQARREDAHKALIEGNLDKALALACQAVLRAPPTDSDEAIDGGVSLALALWQRSEILLAAGHAHAALMDLRLALKEHLPARMRANYYWRMGHCYKGTGEPTRAKVSYELASRLFGNDEASRAQLERDLAALDFTTTPPTLKQLQPDITVTGGAKLNMPALSKLVKINEEENKGRFAVANSTVKTGDVLLVDTPYAACLLHDYYGTHCLHCFKRLDDYEEEAPMWCPKCSGVAFCSCQCRDAAVSTYHVYECQFLDLFIGSGMSILSHIALRMVTQAGFDASLSIHSKYISTDVKTVECSALNDIEGSAKKSKMKSRKERLNRSKKGLKMSDKNAKEEDGDGKEENLNFEESLEMKAAQIYSLCTHAEQRKGEDFMKKIVMGMFLTECLKKAGFFKKCEPEDIAKAKKAVCELIVRNLQLLQFNAHELYETVRGPHQFNGSKPLYIAVGIYPTGALFNHECYPAVARYFQGKKLVLRATRPLEPGEVISENYGPHFLVRNFKERQRALTSRYWFRCDCPACREDWPTLKQMSADAPTYLRCSNTSCTWKFKANAKALPSKCTKCNTGINKDYVKTNLEEVEKYLTAYQDGARMMEEERTEDAIRALCEGVEGCARVAAPPQRDTHLAQEALRSCFAAAGNVHRVKDSNSKSKSN